MSTFWSIFGQSWLITEIWRGTEACNHTLMVENEETMPKFCNTKMAHKGYTAYRPKMWNLESAFFCSILLFNMTTFDQFLANLGSKLITEIWRGKEACNHTWMVENEEAMLKLCNTKIYTAYRPQMWNLDSEFFLVEFSFSNMLVWNSYWPIAAQNRKLKEVKSLYSKLDGWAYAPNLQH